MPRFWVSWYAPVVRVIEKNDELGDLVERSGPEFSDTVHVVGEWTSGCRMSDDASTVCALIDAPSQDAIDAALSKFEVRFIEPRPDDYTPGDRFPMPDTQ